MERSTDRILTSHAGSLARPVDLIEMMRDPRYEALRLELAGPCIAGLPARLRLVRLPGSTGNVSLQLPNGAPNFTIASVGAMPAPAHTTVAIVPGSGGTACPTASGAGCVTAQSSRSLGAMALGGLPTPKPGDLAPSGLSGSPSRKATKLS